MAPSKGYWLKRKQSPQLVVPGHILNGTYACNKVVPDHIEQNYPVKYQALQPAAPYDTD
jgi:hypothetical protein